MLRVLCSYPLRFNKRGIGLTAWYQVDGLIKRGAEVDLFCASCDVSMDSRVHVHETMKPCGIRVPLRLLGSQSYHVHDHVVRRHLQKYHGEYQIVHCWPMGGVATLTEAFACGIKTFVERPNTHTEYAFEVVRQECERLHYTLPRGHSHHYDARKLEREKQEYAIADKLLCPSQFVYDSYIRKGFSESKLSLYHYGYDPELFYPQPEASRAARPFRAVFIGNCEPRKGLHYALEAWLGSAASRGGEFLICGNYVKGYRELLQGKVNHPSIREIGFTSEVRSVLSECDIMVFPTIEEGSAIVTYEARACGCVILVSEAAGAWGENKRDLLIHRVGDVQTLRAQIDLLYNDRSLYKKMQRASLDTIKSYTWGHMAEKLIGHYEEALK